MTTKKVKIFGPAKATCLLSKQAMLSRIFRRNCRYSEGTPESCTSFSQVSSFAAIAQSRRGYCRRSSPARRAPLPCKNQLLAVNARSGQLPHQEHKAHAFSLDRGHRSMRRMSLASLEQAQQQEASQCMLPLSCNHAQSSAFTICVGL